MDLLRIYLRREVNELCRNGIRLRVIGDRSGLATDIREYAETAERLGAGASMAPAAGSLEGCGASMDP